MVDEHGFDVGHFAEAQDRIALPVAVGHGAFVIEGNGLLQTPRQRLDRPALQLVAQTIGVDHATGVGGDPELAHADVGRLVIHSDLGDDGGAALAILVPRESQPPSTVQSAAGGERGIEYCDGAGIVAKVAPAKLVGA